MRCNGSNWAVFSPGSWDGFRNDVWALWAGVIMRLEHHLVGGYVRYISPHIIIIKVYAVHLKRQTLSNLTCCTMSVHWQVKMSRPFLAGKSIVLCCCEGGQNESKNQLKKCPCVHVWVNSQNSQLTDFNHYTYLLLKFSYSWRDYDNILSDGFVIRIWNSRVQMLGLLIVLHCCLEIGVNFSFFLIGFIWAIKIHVFHPCIVFLYYRWTHQDRHWTRESLITIDASLYQAVWHLVTPRTIVE